MKTLKTRTKNEITEEADVNTHSMVFEIFKKVYNKNSKILITGSGRGAFESRLLNFGITPKSISSCDINPKEFKIKEIKCKKVDLNKKIPYKSRFFDVVISIEVIEHLENPSTYLREMYRVLKMGGILILTSPNVNEIGSKLLFLFKGHLKWFKEEPRHIFPVFYFLLKRLINQKFTIMKYTTNYNRLPIIHLKLPKNKLFNKAFGKINIWVLKRK